MTDRDPTPMTIDQVERAATAMEIVTNHVEQLVKAVRSLSVLVSLSALVVLATTWLQWDMARDAAQQRRAANRDLSLISKDVSESRLKVDATAANVSRLVAAQSVAVTESAKATAALAGLAIADQAPLPKRAAARKAAAAKVERSAARVDAVIKGEVRPVLEAPAPK